MLAALLQIFAGREVVATVERRSLVPGLFRSGRLAPVTVVHEPQTVQSSSQHVQVAVPVEGESFSSGLEVVEGRNVMEEQTSSPLVATETFDPLATVPVGDLPVELALSVPFTPQAPSHKWEHPFDEACEESSMIMIEYYLRGEELHASAAEAEIRQLVNWQTERDYGVDLSAEQIATVARQYYKRRAAVYKGGDVSIENIQRLLVHGYPVIIPVAGRELGNPFFIGDGPPYHVIVLTGYDDGHFIANEPGTRFGAGYRYPKERIAQIIHDWAGSKENVYAGEPAMVVLGV